MCQNVPTSFRKFPNQTATNQFQMNQSVNLSEREEKWKKERNGGMLASNRQIKWMKRHFYGSKCDEWRWNHHQTPSISFLFQPMLMLLLLLLLQLSLLVMVLLLFFCHCC